MTGTHILNVLYHLDRVGIIDNFEISVRIPHKLLEPHLDKTTIEPCR